VLRAPNELIKIWDLDGGLGGPIKKDRLWFFLNVRHRGDRTYVTGMYYNKNAGDPTKWTYEPRSRESRRPRRHLEERDAAAHVAGERAATSSASSGDEQSMCIQSCVGEQPGGVTHGVSPRRRKPSRSPIGKPVKQRHVHSSTVTNKLLLEGAYGDVRVQLRQGAPEQQSRPDRRGGAGRPDPGAVVFARRCGRTARRSHPGGRGSATYVTGTHKHEGRLRGRLSIPGPHAVRQQPAACSTASATAYRTRSPNSSGTSRQYNRLGFHAVHAAGLSGRSAGSRCRAASATIARSAGSTRTRSAPIDSCRWPT
jgi:hypothetical protein